MTDHEALVKRLRERLGDDEDLEEIARVIEQGLAERREGKYLPWSQLVLNTFNSVLEKGVTDAD